MRLKKMSYGRNADMAWVLLLLLSLMGGGVGHQVQPGFLVTLVVALMSLIKGRLVIDCFMDLDKANPVIKRIVYGFCVLIPVLMLLTYLWEAQLIKLSRMVLSF